ncbi:MAG: protein kinase domain-containing protein [Kofleriaceae bacterium]
MSREAVGRPSSEKLIGEVLASRYQIELKLGEGAMGAVYKARHVKVGRPFAVKVLHPKLLEDLKVSQRFDREAELAGRLRHPNVVGVVDVGETTEGLRDMVKDFAEGLDLAALLNDAPMPPERVINLVRQLLEGLYHAHEAGLIHRDFKPENVIVEQYDHGNEVPRIVDFGIAILREGGESVDAAGRLTTNGLVLGTPHYMAPEQAVADPIDHRIDLFALGIVLYEMLCGKLPFDGSGAEVARANLLLDPPLISQRVPYLEVDPLLEALSRRLMAKKRESRPATAKAARELLDLIERDRAAAAAALGVPLDIGVREAQVTQPVAAQRPHPPSEPPPLAFESQPAPRTARVDATPSPTTPSPAPLEAPASSAMATPVAVVHVPDGPRAQQHDVPAASSWTDHEEPPSRRRWLIAGGVGVVGVGAVLAIAIGTRGGDAPARAQPETIAVRPEPPATGSAAPVEPAAGSAAPVEPTAVEPAAGSAVEPAAVEPAAGSAVEPTAGSAVEPAAGSAVEPTAVEPTHTTKIQPTPTRPDRPKVTRVDRTKPAPEQPRDRDPTPPPPGGEGPVSAGSFAALYAAVGSDLKKHKAAGVVLDDLDERYRLISYNAVIGDIAKREAAHAALLKIRAAIAKRAK